MGIKINKQVDKQTKKKKKKKKKKKEKKKMKRKRKGPLIFMDTPYKFRNPGILLP